MSTGVVLLAGSSGRIDHARAELLRQTGATVEPVQWFGGPGQPPVPRLVPLETVTTAVDRLAEVCDRVVAVGLSFGAEAVLLAATVDDRIAAVAAFAPTHVAWEGHAEDGEPPVAKWTWQGTPVPFVPLDRAWTPHEDPPAYIDAYRSSLQVADPAAVAAARIPVERITGEILLVVGGGDRVWDCAESARVIAAAREGVARTTLVQDPDAGHRAVLPGEVAATGGQAMARGGDPVSDARLGAAAWPHLLRLIHY